MTTIYELGPFLLDPGSGVLTHHGRPTPLGARAVAVLHTLVRTPQQYVRKAAIMDAAWPDVVVEENSLAAQISAIRRVLGRAPGGERWVETLARRGYRFVGPVSEVREGAAAAGEGPSNLPQPTSSFVGRERELVEVKRLLPHTRLLTLLGVGGIGKTRLALQVADEVTAAYRDGVWFVDLALLADRSLVPSAVAQALGVREVAGRPILETLCAQTKSRQALLVLDNCEHLLDACAEVADRLLRACGDLTIVATSREPLRVAGEQIYALPTLSLPASGSSDDDVARSEAVQLFVARARQQQPGFDMTAGRTQVIARICTRLDGIPLALELAAARVRSLSLEQVDARLDDRFRLLTEGARNALPRHQTLRATLDWSHDLLDERERRVLRRLSVFAGGFALEAASFVASDGAIDPADVTDMLSRLVSRSLVVADTRDASARYRLLETTRAYALERLEESGETDRIRHRHAEYLLSFYDSAANDWLRMREEDWYARYLPELDNVRTALDWALGPGGDPATGVRLCGASAAIWMELSLAGEGRRRLQAAIDLVGDAPQLDGPRLWLWMGMLTWMNAPERSVQALRRAVELYRALGDASGIGFSLVLLALGLGDMNRLDEAAAAVVEAAPLLEGSGLPRALARHSEVTGFLRMRTGDLAAARPYYERAISLYRTMGLRREVYRMLGNLADLNWVIGDLDAAVEGFRENLANLREAGLSSQSSLAWNLASLAGVHVQRGELDEALAAIREGLPVLKELGHAWVNMDHFALRLALAGHAANAARLAGYADAAYAGKKASRGPNELRARNRLHGLLRERLGREIDALLESGAKMSEDEACRIAIG